jgi:hypothetical protein
MTVVILIFCVQMLCNLLVERIGFVARQFWNELHIFHISTMCS